MANASAQGITPAVKAAQMRRGFSPSPTAIKAPTCGPIVMGAISPNIHRPPKFQAFFQSGTPFAGAAFNVADLRFFHQRCRGVPASSTTPAPVEYPATATTAAQAAGKPSATAEGMAATK